MNCEWVLLDCDQEQNRLQECSWTDIFHICHISSFCSSALNSAHNTRDGNFLILIKRLHEEWGAVGMGDGGGYINESILITQQGEAFFTFTASLWNLYVFAS